MPSVLAKTRQLNTDNSSNHGAALFLALMVLGFVFVVGIMIAEIQFQEIQFGTNEHASARALAAADAGIERALYKIIKESSTGTLPDSCTPDNCSLCEDQVSCKYINNQTLENGSIYYVIVPRGSDNPVQEGTSTEYIIVRSIGVFHGIERSLEVNLYTKLPAP